MTLTRWNPIREMQAMQEEMNRLFSRADSSRSDSMRYDDGKTGGQQLWTLPVDVIETGEAIKLKASLPGVDPKDINIHVKDNVLTISAERRFEEKVEEDKYCWIEQRYGSFNRSLTLPQHADPEAIQARYENGMVELTIPKRESAKARKIELDMPSGQNQPHMFENAENGSSPTS
jgi:HSP20 family protein